MGKLSEECSLLIVDLIAEEHYAYGGYDGWNSDSLLCSLEDEVAYSTGLGIIMIYGYPLLGRVNKIIDRVVEAGYLEEGETA